VTVHKNGGGTTSAIAADISSAGMLLRVERPSDFRVGEQVTVEVEMPDHPTVPFSAWGAATVVRIDGSMFAVQLQAGTFTP
jgi:c-di-GMP-binding flagellar brake protein YcgR